MTDRHTPGQYQLVTDRNLTGSPSRPFLFIRATGVGGESPTFVAELGIKPDRNALRCPDAQEAEANGRLFCAAPEMVDALRDIGNLREDWRCRSCNCLPAPDGDYCGCAPLADAEARRCREVARATLITLVLAGAIDAAGGWK